MYLATETGQRVLPGTVITALVGPHAGRRFHFVDLHADGERIVVRYARPLRNAVAHLHPSVFALVVQEEITHLHHALNALHHGWQRVDEWIFAGFFALVPLAFFEHYHLAERLFELFGRGEH